MTTPVEIGQQLGQRFHVVNALPATTVVAFMALILLSGSLTDSASLSSLRSGLAQTSITELALVALAAVLTAITLNAFQTRMTKLLEGYWRPTGARCYVMERCLAREAERRFAHGVNQTAQWRPTKWESFWIQRLPQNRRDVVKLRNQEWAHARFIAYPPRPRRQLTGAAGGSGDTDRLMPTRLGNALRSAEDYAGNRFGIPAVKAVPYLLSVADETTATQVGDARTALDVCVSFTWIWVLCTTAGLFAFLDDGPWLVVPALTAILASSFYEAAIAAAHAYGRRLSQLVDLYRFDVLVRLHWPLPANLEKEISSNRSLWRLLRGEAERNERLSPYKH